MSYKLRMTRLKFEKTGIRYTKCDMVFNNSFSPTPVSENFFYFIILVRVKTINVGHSTSSVNL